MRITARTQTERQPSIIPSIKTPYRRGGARNQNARPRSDQTDKFARPAHCVGSATLRIVVCLKRSHWSPLHTKGLHGSCSLSNYKCTSEYIIYILSPIHDFPPSIRDPPLSDTNLSSLHDEIPYSYLFGKKKNPRKH